MNKAISKKGLERKVKAALKKKVDSDRWTEIWDHLERREHLDINEDGTRDYNFNDIVKEADQLIAEFGFAFETRRMVKASKEAGTWEDRSPSGDDSTLAIRQEVLSEIYADMADGDDDVIAFREEVLGGKFIEWEKVEGWIKRRTKKEKAEGLPGGYLTIPKPDSRVIDIKIDFDNPGVPYSVGVDTLAYAKPGDKWAYHEAVRVGGTLDRLRKLSESLAKYYGWQDAQATVFILTTDVIPEVSLVRASVTVAPGARRMNGMLRARPGPTRRITLEIDPTSTDKQVATVYRRIRRKLFPKDKRGRVNFKPQRDKALRLAQFYVRQPEDNPARKRMDLWNMKHTNDEWGYTVPGNFNRDCKAAVERLLNPGFGPPEI